MKIDRPTIRNTENSTTEKTDETTKSADSGVELQGSPKPKSDSVEIKLNSFYNFDNNAPKLDPGQTNLANANAVPATLLPGVPFQEKVELPKTLPDGTSVDSNVKNGDLGFGRKRTGPNHMGIDLKAGGTEIRNQLDDALKLREGDAAQSTAKPAGETVNYTGLGSGKKTEPKYEAGFQRPGTGLISAEKDEKGLIDKAKDAAGKVIDYLRDVSIAKYGKIPGTGEAMSILDMPGKTEEITGDAKDHVRGIAGAVYPEARLNRIYDQGNNKYVNPDAPPGTEPVPVTDESIEKIGVRLGSNKQPGVEENLQNEIDGSQLSETDPRRKLISNPLLEDTSTIGSGEAVQVLLNAKGPDTVNPNDPDSGGGEPIVIDPNRPK